VATVEAGYDCLGEPFEKADLLDLLSQYLGVEFAWADNVSEGIGGRSRGKRIDDV